MNHKMLTKFAIEGMKKSKKTLVPFILASSITVMSYYILSSLGYTPYIYHDGKEAFYGAQTIAATLGMAAQIVSLFSVIFLFYANQFAMRERKTEIGLYGILGLSRKHIAYIMVLEVVMKAVVSVGAGMLVGTFLNKLMLLALYKVIGDPPVSGMLICPEAIIDTLVLFAFIFLACLIYNVSSVSIANPIALLRSNKAGEKEPKVKILMLIVGVITLGMGYAMAIGCKSTADAWSCMLVSVLLVICGTYCLFITGSIFILKVLKRNKKFYYRTRNFISVSNLMYRMKHNAAGLASICVLSTGVILLLTCASSLMMLGEQNINRIYQHDIKVEIADNRGDLEKDYYTDALKRVSDAAGIQIDNVKSYKYRRSLWNKTETGLQLRQNEGYFSVDKDIDMYFMALDDYNQYANTEIALNDREILVYSSRGETRDKIDIIGKEFEIKGEVDYDAVSATNDSSMTLFETYIIVFRNEDIIKEILADDVIVSDEDMYEVYIGCDIEESLTEEQMQILCTKWDEEIGDELRGINGDSAFEIKFKQVEREIFYKMYGGAFFVGIFLAILFLMATVMIIYYKQMSEGFEDQRRYQILSCVGLTEREVKVTIKRQVMILFFLPVVTAIVHMVVASNVLRLFMQLILVVDAFTFNMAISIVVLVFVVVYAVVYKITSGQYYKIVNA